MVVVNVFGQQPLEMPLIDRDDMIEQFPTAASYKTFSAIPFCHGLRKLVCFGSMPKLLIVATASYPKLVARSKIRYFGAEASGKASRIPLVAARSLHSSDTLAADTSASK